MELPREVTVNAKPVASRDIERATIEDALAQKTGNRTHAARQLGISLRTLQNRLKLYGLQQPVVTKFQKLHLFQGRVLEVIMAESRLKVVNEIKTGIEQLENYHFVVHFDKAQYADLDVDEPAPLGKDEAPNPVRLLAAAVGSCLSASLLFCAKKAHVDLSHIRTNVTTQGARNEKGRLRISSIEIEIEPGVPAEFSDKLPSCTQIFQDFCTVTESVRHGIDVNVSVNAVPAMEPAQTAVLG